MLQALLSDRFKLAIHRGTAIQPVYALVVAKGGLTVKEVSPDAGVPVAAAEADAPSGITGFFGETLEHSTPNASGSGETTTISNPRMGTVREIDGPNLFQHMEAPRITFEGLAELLDRMMPSSTSVIDMTGLKGRYQLVLEVSLNDLPKAPMPTSDTATRENAEMDREQVLLQRFNEGLRKLGLQLERRKGPLETLVVDHVEKTPTEN
jgi:uncharacterized protein (TIGR03435 family)